MKKLMLLVVLFPMVTMADGKDVCVQLDHHRSRLCAKIVGFQDSSMEHHAYGVTEFKYEDGDSLIPMMRYTAREICREFIGAAYPDSRHIRPNAPFGLSKEPGKVWVMHSNGNCTAKSYLKLVGCYSDI